jgi:hypothetical protein
VTVRDNLAEIDVSLVGEERREAIDRCAPGAIVWYDDAGQPQRGLAARKILRQAALPLR